MQSNVPSGACPCSDIPRPSQEKVMLDREAGLKFLQTPEYKQEFDQAIAGARAACEKHMNEPNVAIVSDLDETLLDNSAMFAKNPNYTMPEFRAWVRQSAAGVLSPTAEFLSWARKNGFAIFFVTGRRENERRATIENLLHNGIGYDGLFMRRINDDRPAEDFKSEYRKQIEDMGFKVIVSIGDQVSDLYGGHAEDCEKLPNHIYYIP
jgi:acid phosphatase